MCPPRRSTVARPEESDASAAALESRPEESAGRAPEATADPRLVVRDAHSLGLVAGDGTLAFGMANRGSEAVRLSGLEFDCANSSVVVGGGYAVWVDARESTRVSVGPGALPATVEFERSPVVEPGETAVVRVYGFRYADGTSADVRECRSRVTIATERGGHRYETAAHLTV
jgi:hypothetical protein